MKTKILINTFYKKNCSENKLRDCCFFFNWKRSIKKFYFHTILMEFSSFLSSVWLLIERKRLLLLRKPKHLQQLLSCIACNSRYQHKYVSLPLCRRMYRYIFRAGRFQFSSPSSWVKHHNGYHTFQQFRLSLYALPKIKK